MKKVLVVGSLNMDVLVGMKTMPAIGETVMGESYWYNPGGKGANQAYTIAKLGGDVTMLGCLGNDEFGRILLDNLTSVGVDTKHIEMVDSDATGTAFIFTDANAKNSIVAIAGANQRCTISYIKKHEQLLKECDYILLQMEIPSDAVYYVIEKAKSYGKTIILNPAPAPLDLPKSIMDKIDIITPNETELGIINGQNTDSLDKIIESSKKLVEYGIKNVIITLGEQGALWTCEQDCKLIESRAVEAVDSTAAGDCFNGTLVTELAKGNIVESAIRKANIVASISVTRKGAQASIPNNAEVEQILKG